MSSLLEKLFVFTYSWAFVNPNNFTSSDLGISNLSLPSLWFGSVSVVSDLNVRTFQSKG